VSLTFGRRTSVVWILGGTLIVLLSARQQSAFLARSDADDSSSLGTYESTAGRIKALLYDAPQARARLLTSSGPPVDVMLHHGGAYSARERARLEGRIHDGAVLVLLDSHTDLMDQVGLVPRPATIAEADRIEYDIASHIVPSLADGLVTEIVHVGNKRLDRLGRLPAHVPGVRHVWVVRVRDRTGVEAAVLLDGDRPTPATALARMQSQLAQRARSIDEVLRRRQLWVEPRARSIEDLQVVHIADEPVTIRTTFPDDLPDLSDRTRSVIWDIDADFFVLGPQTDMYPDAGEIARDVDWTLDRLAGRGMRPGSVSIALSPGYTPEHEMAPVAAALLAALERVGVSRYARRAGGMIALDLHERARDALPEILAVRAATASEPKDDATIDEVIGLCDRVIARYADDAGAEEQRERARSPFARTGNPDWMWQPSPVVGAHRELNAVGEAYALRSDLLARRGRYAEARADRLTLEKRYTDAYQPVSVRYVSPGYGWIVGRGWMPIADSREVPICGPGAKPGSTSSCTN
jgi:hypothetical protein